MAGIFGTRAQVAPVRQTQIQPPGLPGSTFVRPVQRETGGNARALADALGGLNSALQNYAMTDKSLKEDPNSQANKEQVARLQQMNKDQIASEIASGSLDGQRVQKDAAEVLLGERAYSDLRTAVTEGFNNGEFDQSNGNFDEWFETKRSAIAEGLPSEIARGHLYRLSKDFRQAWAEKDVENKTSVVKDQMGTTVIDSFRSTVEDAMGLHGKSAKDAARMVFEKSADNRTFLGMSGQEQNETIFAIAEEYALKGQVDVARELLEGERTGADGKSLGSLASTRKYGVKALRLLKQAEDQSERDFLDKDRTYRSGIAEKVDNGEFTLEEADALKGKVPESYLNRQVLQSEENRRRITAKIGIEQSKADARLYSQQQENEVYVRSRSDLERLGGITRLRDIEIPNEAGTGTKKITVQDQIDDGIRVKEDAWAKEERQRIDAGEDEDTARAAVDAKRLDWYAGQKVKNETWDNLLNGFAGRAAADTVMQGGETSKYLVQNAELFRRLKAGNPAYVRTFLSDDSSRSMLDYYDRLVTTNRMPKEEALRVAAGWTSRAPWEQATERQLSAKAEQNIIRDAINDLDLDDRTSDRTLITKEVREMAERENMTESEIKKALPKRIADTTVAINGVLVPDHRDLPDDFPPLMEQYLADLAPMIAKRRGMEIDPEDLYVRPVSGESKWEVHSKRWGGTGFAILPKDLQALRGKREAADKEIADKLIDANAEEQTQRMEEYKASIEADRKLVLEWERRADARPSRMNKSIAAKLRDNLEERVANDAANSGMSRRERWGKEGQRYSKEQEVLRKQQNRALEEFFKGIIPSVKIGNTYLTGGPESKKPGSGNR